MNYSELRTIFPDLPKTQLETGFCAEWFHTVNTFLERGGVDYSVKIKNTAETLGVEMKDYSHMNPQSNKSYADLGRKGGKNGGGRNRRSFGMSRRKRK